MNNELQATSEAGRKFVALAEEHAADFATRADQHDREASFPHENIKALQESGYMAGPIPEEFGGMGVPSILDLAIGMSRLARGCASTAIAANVHIAAAWQISLLWRWREEGDPALTPAVEGLARGIGAEQIMACAPTTEAGTDLVSPMTEATRVEGGYSLTGRKMFGTLSPAANLMFVSCRIKEGDGYVRSLAIVPKGALGVTVLDNWDALGMRASGSHDVTFEDVNVPSASMLPPTPWGRLDAPFADMAASINLSLVACSLGIAEAARDLAVELAMRPKGPKGKKLADRIPIQQLIAEIEIDLFAGRAVLERAGQLVDQHFATYAPGQAPEAEGFEMLKQHQTTVGGSSYMSKSPFSRLYRDVRAQPFMQPFAPYEALEYIGKVTLGVNPQLDR